MMKPGAFCVTAFFLLVNLLIAAPGRSQDADKKVISLDYRNANLLSVIKSIEEKANVVIMYEITPRIEKMVVDIQVRDKTVGEILNLLTRGRNLKWTLKKNTIRLIDVTDKEAGNVTNQYIAASTAVATPVTGIVVGYNGKPIEGAGIMIKGTMRGIATNAEGKFSLEVQPGDILIASYIGYESREIAVGDKSFLGTIALIFSDNSLDETVVIAYGKSTRKFTTGSVRAVKSKELAMQPVNNPLQALQGNVAGMYVSQSNGLPGAAINIVIRGRNSMEAGNDPLYIIDGVPFNAQPINQQAGGSYSSFANGNTSPFNSINPNDIESISVLKDADATAMYGSRAANGLILITTKKGSAGKAKVTANVYTGIGHVASKLKMLNTDEYLALRRQAFDNDNMVPDETNAPDLTVWGNKNIDFQKELLGNASRITEASASISGGSETTTFLLNSTYRKENNVFPGNRGYKRGSVLFSINHNSADKKFTAAVSTSLSKDDNRLSPSDLTGAALSLPPNYPLYNSDGSMFWDGNFFNPLATASDPAISKTDNIITNLSLGYKVLPELVLKASLGYNKMNNDQKVAYLKSNSGPSAFETFATMSTNLTEGFIIEPQLNFDKSIGLGKLSVVAGGTYQMSDSRTPFSTGLSGFSNERLVFDPASASQIVWLETAASEYRYASVFGRINYQWRGKYILNMSGRRDGSSRFGTNKKLGNFGAVGAAWIFSDEAFIRKSLAFLSFGKLRASYGTIGNDQIPNYGYISTYRSANYRYGDIPAIYPARIANPNYSWESTRKAELALDLGFWNDRILITAAGFSNRTGNMLVATPLTPQTGFSSFQANLPAIVQNTGVELELTTTNIRRENLNWKTSLNVTFTRNKLASFPNIRSSTYANSYIIGESLNIIPVYRVSNIKDGIAGIEDVNNDGEISAGLAANGLGDYVVGGQTAPRCYGGLSNAITYKGLQLDILFQFAFQDGYSNRFGSTSPPGSLYNQDAAIVKEGLKPTADFSSVAYESYILYSNSDRAISSASFGRLKNVSLSYSLPSKWIKSLHFNECAFYVRGQNLFTLTNFQGLDPETQNRFGLVVPPLRIYTIGIQCSL